MPNNKYFHCTNHSLTNTQLRDTRFAHPLHIWLPKYPEQKQTGHFIQQKSSTTGVNVAFISRVEIPSPVLAVSSDTHLAQASHSALFPPCATCQHWAAQFPPAPQPAAQADSALLGFSSFQVPYFCHLAEPSRHLR